jgi:membrane protein implicated in regulation of membrane protease activity
MASPMQINPAQAWLILGVILVITEMLTTTFILLFFGIAALAVAALTFFGVESLILQILVFSVVGVGGLLLFRNKIKTTFLSRSDVIFDGLQNTVIHLQRDIPPHTPVSIMHQGTTWTAINETDTAMKPGDRARILRVDGVKLILVRES